MEPALINLCKNFKSYAALLTVLAVAILHDGYTNTAGAVVFNINDRATPRISIRVGNQNSINRVTFNVAGTDVGNGIPVAGSSRINITLVIRATAANPLTGFLTVDSSTPLDNGSGSTMPVSEISWVARDGDIPSGSYAGTTNQALASFVSSVRVRDRHTFEYRNTNVFDPGTYNGQVTYTWAAP
ncbi:MAG: hypothetical protein GQ537_02630 [Gammaproteobacteria bacterium]|nr:hypothetical protein [Gammaproteobacteria bacterium]